MASNKLPMGEQPLLDWVAKLLAGAQANGAAIGLSHHTYATLNPKYTTADTARNDFKNSDADLSAAYLTLEAASEDVGEWLTTARDTFKKFFGKTWNPTWTPTGWDDGKTAVDRKPEERRDRLAKVIAFLTANATYENAGQEVTVAIATPKFNALKAAILDIPTKESAYTAAQQAKNNALKALRAEASALVNELGDLLDGNDPLWEAFGLNRPDAAGPAGEVPDLVVTAIAGGFIATWGAADNGHLYHVEIRILGVDTDFHSVKTTTDLDAQVTGLTPGAQVDVCLVALNTSGSEGPRTAAQRITVL